MPKASKPGHHAARAGTYHSWAECEPQVKGSTGANEFMAARAAPRQTVPAASSSRATAAPDPKSHPSHPTAEDNCDIVYCDGACKGNGKTGSIAGIGVWWGHHDPRNLSERCPGDQTNNRAELIAIVRVLETTPYLERRLLIKTDSYYSIQCVTTWIFKWMKNGFLTADGKPVKNRTLIKYLVALLHVRRQTNQVVEFKHVRGHVGIEGNEAADQLANLGATGPVAPERNWEELEKQVLQSRPVKVVEDDLKTYASGLLSDDELAELAGTNVTPSGNAAQGRTMPYTRVRAVYNKSVSGPSRVPSSKPRSTAFGKEEPEMYAACLLGDGELSALGRIGTFDSDF